MIKINLFISKFRRKIYGQTATEYALILGGVALAIYLMVKQGIAERIRGSIEGVGAKINAEFVGTTGGTVP